MTTKFIKDTYAKMRAKAVRITGRGSPAVLATSVTPVVSGVEMTRTASPSTSIEELLTPASKQPRLSSNEKEKVDSRTSTIWSDERLAVDRAHGVITANSLKVFSGVPSNTVASCHVHRLVQVRSSCFFFFFFTLFLLTVWVLFSQVLGESLHITTEYLTQEAKVASLTSKIEAMEAETSKLK